MKILATLMVFMSVNAYAAYTPIYEARVTANNTITLTVGNDSGLAVDCEYTMSWLENTLSFKRVSGEMALVEGAIVEVNVHKDIAAKVSFLKAKVVCE